MTRSSIASVSCSGNRPVAGFLRLNDQFAQRQSLARAASKDFHSPAPGMSLAGRRQTKASPSCRQHRIEQLSRRSSRWPVTQILKWASRLALADNVGNRHLLGNELQFEKGVGDVLLLRDDGVVQALDPVGLALERLDEDRFGDADRW